MTVSANATLDYTRDQLLTSAFRLAGVWHSGQSSADTQSADDISMGSDFMNLELMALQAENVVLRTAELTTLPLVASTPTYNLAVDTIDIATGPSDQAGTIINTSGTESIVTVMSQAEYLDISDKTAAVTDIPTRVYIDYGARLAVTFWPVPDAAAVTWRYSRVRLLKDMDTGSVTVDLARRWLQYVTYAVAAQIAAAKNLGLDKVSWLRKQADAMKAKCLASDVERGRTRFRVTHRGKHW